MKVYAANYYDWDNSKFLGIFSTSEKAIEALKNLYNENGGIKGDYAVTALTMDNGTKDDVTATLEEIEIFGNKFEN